MHVTWGIGEGVFVFGSADLGFLESDSRMLLLDLSFDEGTGGQHVDEGRGPWILELLEIVQHGPGLGLTDCIFDGYHQLVGWLYICPGQRLWTDRSDSRIWRALFETVLEGRFV